MKTNLHTWCYLTGTIKALDMERLTVQQQNAAWVEGDEITIKNAAGKQHWAEKQLILKPDQSFLIL